MKCSHRIRVSRACFEFDRGSTCAATYDRQTEKLADWSGQFFRRHICVRIVSQIATDLAVRELVVVNFNNVIHFSAVDSCIYKSRASRGEPCTQWSKAGGFGLPVVAALMIHSYW